MHAHRRAVHARLTRGRTHAVTGELLEIFTPAVALGTIFITHHTPQTARVTALGGLGGAVVH
jgi:hypothetical protein